MRYTISKQYLDQLESGDIPPTEMSIRLLSLFAEVYAVETTWLLAEILHVHPLQHVARSALQS